MSRAHSLPKNVHLMGARSRVNRLCGATTGGFVRLDEEGKRWLRRFLASGGGLCPECEKVDVER